MKNKKIHIGILVCSILWVVACSTMNRSRIESRSSTTDGAHIAVLDFVQNGFFNGEKLGPFAADELTAALFIQRRLRVKDRAQVKANMAEQRISPSQFSTNEIKEFGQTLGADFLILGEITRLDGLSVDTENDGRMSIQIMFRIVSSEDGDVIGIVTRRGSQKTESKKIVSEMIGKMAGSVRL